MTAADSSSVPCPAPVPELVEGRRAREPRSRRVHPPSRKRSLDFCRRVLTIDSNGTVAIRSTLLMNSREGMTIPCTARRVIGQKVEKTCGFKPYVVREEL